MDPDQNQVFPHLSWLLTLIEEALDAMDTTVPPQTGVDGVGGFWLES